MADLLPVPAATLPALVAALAMAGLAAWLLALDGRDRLHRSFALFLLLRAFWIGSFPFTRVFDDYAGRVRVYFLLALPFAALYLAYVYRVRYRVNPGPLMHRAIPPVLLVSVGLAEILYLIRHALFRTAETYGPLTLFLALPTAAYAALALLLARDAARAPTPPRRRALLLASLGFALEPVYLATFQVLVTLTNAGGAHAPLPFWLEVAQLTYGAGLVLVLVAAASLLRAARAGAATPRAETARYLAALAAPLTAAVLAFVLIRNAPLRTSIAFLRVFDGLWTLALPALVAVALVRHHLFDIDVRVKWTLRSGTVAAAFVATFFVVSEIAKEVFASRLGPYLGILAVGLLLFFLHPLQRLADRIANAAMPRAKPVSDLDRQERAALYREQLELAWMDGALTRKEQQLLHALRERLGLPPDEAHHLEREAAHGAGRPPLGSRGGPGGVAPVDSR